MCVVSTTNLVCVTGSTGATSTSTADSDVHQKAILDDIQATNLVTDSEALNRTG